MKCIVLIAIFFQLLASGICMAACQDGHFEFNNDQSDRTMWMSRVVDDVRLSNMSILGTHDSMTAPVGQATGLGYVKTQIMPFQDQLNSGVRFLDWRLRRNGNCQNRLMFYHGTVKVSDINLDQAISYVNQWLKWHPGETILIRVKNEAGSDEKEPDDFARRVKEAFQSSNLYVYTNTVSQSDNPKLEDVRGKIVILKDYDERGYGIYSIPYDKNMQNQFDLWDPSNYCTYCSSNELATIKMDNEKEGIKKGIGYGAPIGMSKINLTYTSASTYDGTNNQATTPLEYAERINWQKLIPTVNSMPESQVIGVVVVDFYGRDWPQDFIYDRNTFKNPCHYWSSNKEGVVGDIYRYRNPYSNRLEYFLLKKPHYSYFPVDATSNEEWDYRGTNRLCN
ncbi:phosphatidylinositol-specific phospholipase C domain-containing protein [Chromobacterium haemolyticum]|uniref:phosphatidylinositol-specific phospholipase C domain-containing protein n=1 Tax=Chromobacterium haemolyticum TaxID=394935 RepID=UPI0009DD932E|nr:phosphatidylinositol-specific phospholipase C domain-containing protein [Chromobacterium haemolyticum]